MKAERIIFPEPWQARLEPFTVQEIPGIHEIVLRTRTTAISPGTELAVYTGRHSALKDPSSAWPRFPFEPGYSLVGDVIAVGSDVKDFKVGQRVYARAGHASHSVLSPEQAAAVRIPEGIEDEEASYASLVAIVLNGVRLAEVQIGEVVVVIGLGMIGQLAAQIARVAGALETIGSDLLPNRRKLAERLGISCTVDPESQSLVEIVRSATNGHGADIVIEATGNAKVIPNAFRLAREMGRVVLLGSPHGVVDTDFYSEVHRRSLRIIGAHERSAGHTETPHHRWTTAGNEMLGMTLIAQGRLHVHDLITDVVAPSDAPMVYAKLTTCPGDSLGVIIDWR